MYIVTSKPKRISVNSGLVHMFAAPLGMVGDEHSVRGRIVPPTPRAIQRKSLIGTS
jgi:hypothetical protein